MLGFLEYEAIRERALRHARELASEIKQHISNELEKHMAPLNESLDRLATNISNELDQVRAGLQATIDGLTSENADLKTELQGHVDAIASAQSKVDQLNTDLEANDPAPAEPPADV